ncbi:MAG: hypothetical protein LBL21_05120 [Rickettsiales bacterium]|nr:hypothetical protein [Rickettsiales bacterium]
MKKILLLSAAAFMCHGAALAQQCEPMENFLITDAASCPCGYLEAASAPAPLSCPGTSISGTYQVTCS